MARRLPLASPAKPPAPPWSGGDKVALTLGVSAIVLASAVWLIGMEGTGRLWPAAHAWIDDPERDGRSLASGALWLGFAGTWVTGRLSAALEDPAPDRPARSWRDLLVWREWRNLLLLLGGAALLSWGLPWALGTEETNLFALIKHRAPIREKLAPESLTGLLGGLATLSRLRRVRAKLATSGPRRPATEWLY